MPPAHVFFHLRHPQSATGPLTVAARRPHLRPESSVLQDITTMLLLSMFSTLQTISVSQSHILTPRRGVACFVPAPRQAGGRRQDAFAAQHNQPAPPRPRNIYIHVSGFAVWSSRGLSEGTCRTSTLRLSCGRTRRGSMMPRYAAKRSAAAWGEAGNLVDGHHVGHADRRLAESPSPSPFSAAAHHPCPVAQRPKSGVARRAGASFSRGGGGGGGSGGGRAAGGAARPQGPAPASAFAP